MNKEILKNLSYGVYVVTVGDGAKSTGCVANSIMQVSYNTVAVSINQNNHTNKCIKENKKFAISILSEDVNDDIIPVFGFTSGKNTNKFEKIEKLNVDNIDVVKDSIGYLICEVINIIEVETHTVFIAKITDGDIIQPKKPMTYAYYHTIKKGLSPKSAPTYIEEAPINNDLSYKCKICGYIYNGDITKEPDSYICPVCKKPKEFFEKL